MFGLDKLAGQLILAGVVIAGVLSGIGWYGHTRYRAGEAAEREHWQEVIRAANRAVDAVNREADAAKIDRDKAKEDLKTAAGKIEIVAVPVAISKQCDLPDDARGVLNSINVRRRKP
jgi:hypothetical protein